MKKDTPPKKPLTPFFMFLAKEKEKGKPVGGKEAGQRWASLSDAEKKPFVEQYKKSKDKFDKYLEEVEGVAPRTSSKKKEKPTAFKTSRIRTAWGREQDIKQTSNTCYKALGRVVVFPSWIFSLGKLYV